MLIWAWNLRYKIGHEYIVQKHHIRVTSRVSAAYFQQKIVSRLRGQDYLNSASLERYYPRILSWGPDNLDTIFCRICTWRINWQGKCRRERELAWMPSTNDANEGRWGHYIAILRDEPCLILHQYNAEAMFSRNNTLTFMNTLFEAEDHAFIMQSE